MSILTALRALTWASILVALLEPNTHNVSSFGLHFSLFPKEIFLTPDISLLSLLLPTRKHRGKDT